MDDALVNTLVRSVLSLAVVLAGIASQAAQALTFQLLPTEATRVAGAFATILFFPAIFAAIIGIIGTPDSWLWLTFRLLESFGNDPLGFLLSVPGTIYKFAVPPLPFACPPNPSWIQRLLFREPSEVYDPPQEQQNSAKVKNELWIYINGIATTKSIAMHNRKVLNRMFGRPIYLCHNPTDSILIDLIECLAGKLFFSFPQQQFSLNSYWENEPRQQLIEILHRLLVKADSEGCARVVLISHSQGTIITSNALEELATNVPSVIPLMKKYLEVYAIANCAHQMPGNNVKYLENITNRADTVAWLGVLFPFKGFWQDINRQPIMISGSYVTEQLFWGHLIETHYLAPMMSRSAFRMSRLQHFLHGGLPPSTLIPR
jgi:hypothetical protein